MKLIITEGGKDALTLGEAGYPFVISVPNGAAGDLHKSFEAFDPWLDYAQSIVICGDTDLPGRTRTKYLSDYFGNRCLLTMLPHDCKDISGVVVKYGIDVVREIIDTAKPQHTADIITVGERKEEVLNVLWDEYDHGYDVGCDPLTNHVCRPAHQVGAHAAGWNDKSLGICYEGGLDEDGHPADTRTYAQKCTLMDLLRRLRKDYPHARILGHNQLGQSVRKACPCFDARKEYREL